MIGKQNARRRVWGKMKGMLFRVFKKPPSFLKLLVICLSATPLTKERIEMRIPPSCNAAALVSLLIPRTKRMYTPWEGKILYSSTGKPTQRRLQGTFQQNLHRFKMRSLGLKTCSFFMFRPDHSIAPSVDDIADVPRGGNDGEGDGKKQTKTMI